MTQIAWVRLEGAANVRDIGGHATADGGAVRRREIFRGDSPHRLTANDLAVLGRLGLRATLDLRRPDEVAWLGDGPIAEIVPMTVKLPLDLEAHKGDSLFERYRRFVADRAPALADGIRFLTNASHRPALVHCFAGKDRTGVLVALTLGILGVDPDAIVADYQATEQAAPEFLSLALDELTELYHMAPNSTLVRADADAMERLVAWLLATYGSFEGWADAAGLGEDEVARLRHELIDPVPTLLPEQHRTTTERSKA